MGRMLGSKVMKCACGKCFVVAPRKQAKCPDCGKAVPRAGASAKPKAKGKGKGKAKGKGK